MKKIALSFAAMAIMVAGASHALAQINPFGRWAQPGLTKEESAMVSKAARSVYENPNVKVGDKADWENPKNGNKGSVEATKLFQARGMNCVELLYTFHIKEAEQARNTISMNRCKAPDGTWKILD